jgi:hypothetical protein
MLNFVIFVNHLCLLGLSDVFFIVAIDISTDLRSSDFDSTSWYGAYKSNEASLNFVQAFSKD